MGVLEVQIHTFITSGLDGDECSASRLDRFTPRDKGPSTHWPGNWLGPRTDFDATAKRKIPATAGNRTPIVQPVALSLY